MPFLPGGSPAGTAGLSSLGHGLFVLLPQGHPYAALLLKSIANASQLLPQLHTHYDADQRVCPADLSKAEAVLSDVASHSSFNPLHHCVAQSDSARSLEKCMLEMCDAGGRGQRAYHQLEPPPPAQQHADGGGRGWCARASTEPSTVYTHTTRPQPPCWEQAPTAPRQQGQQEHQHQPQQHQYQQQQWQQQQRQQQLRQRAAESAESSCHLEHADAAWASAPESLAGSAQAGSAALASLPHACRQQAAPSSLRFRPAKRRMQRLPLAES
uniref:Uncharacterized protein n=1 Tax=Calcidiscus leptoporus TaxID=127549 RepID=A0A7S0JGU8_9EUKA